MKKVSTMLKKSVLFLVIYIFTCNGQDLQATFDITAVIEQLSEKLEVIEQLSEKLDALSKMAEQQNRQLQEIHENIGIGPGDCDDIRAINGHNTDGVYQIYLGKFPHRIRTSVFCQMNSSRNWLVLQRRFDGSENFYRTWDEYANGFGDLNREFWLGNEALHLLTSGNRKYKLRVDMEDFEGEKRYAEYSLFSICSASDFYRLTLSGYSGTAGDSLFQFHNGLMFSTKDADHDTAANSNCAIKYKGAWWYSSCHASNLNGEYRRGINSQKGSGLIWFNWHGDNYSLKMTEMKIARVW